jgi:tRNA/tmRNA/rRNA uracil-C5-methylase (TrmA/RlmC/RlmD family)
MTTVPIEIESLAHGGAGVGRVEGRVVFCRGGVPGDRVLARVTEDRGRFLKAEVVEVTEASPQRIAPPCPVFDRCGGCDWQMLSLAGQREAKEEIVRSQLQHLGRVADPPVEPTMAVSPGFGYRNRIDLRVTDGRPALYESGSHRPVPIEDCPLVIEPISDRIRRLRPGAGVDRVTIRASAVTGEGAELRRRRGRWDQGRIYEHVAGRRFRITGRAFFQVNTGGAEALVDLVSELDVGSHETMLDGYAGGGLFSATVGAGDVVAVESDRRALSDLRVNAPEAAVIEGRFETVRLPPVDVAVVDPPRSGLGAAGVENLMRARPVRLAYVSCDPASLARDIALLMESGYRLRRVTPVDMFPQTHHVETVTILDR